MWAFIVIDSSELFSNSRDLEFFQLNLLLQVKSLQFQMNFKPMPRQTNFKPNKYTSSEVWEIEIWLVNILSCIQGDVRLDYFFYGYSFKIPVRKLNKQKCLNALAHSRLAASQAIIMAPSIQTF